MPKSEDFLDLLSEANKLRNKEWDPDNKLTPLFFGTELAGELGEALNVIKKLEREKLGLRGSRETVEHLAEELGDVLICLSLLANEYGIDLRKSTRSKFNASSDKLGLAVRLPVTL